MVFANNKAKAKTKVKAKPADTKPSTNKGLQPPVDGSSASIDGKAVASTFKPTTPTAPADVNTTLTSLTAGQTDPATSAGPITFVCDYSFSSSSSDSPPFDITNECIKNSVLLQRDGVKYREAYLMVSTTKRDDADFTQSAQEMRCAFWESNKRSIAVDEKEGGVGSTSAAEDFLAKRTVASFNFDDEAASSPTSVDRPLSPTIGELASLALTSSSSEPNAVPTNGSTDDSKVAPVSADDSKTAQVSAAPTVERVHSKPMSASASSFRPAAVLIPVTDSYPEEDATYPSPIPIPSSSAIRITAPSPVKPVSAGPAPPAPEPAPTPVPAAPVESQRSISPPLLIDIFSSSPVFVPTIPSTHKFSLRFPLTPPVKQQFELGPSASVFGSPISFRLNKVSTPLFQPTSDSLKEAFPFSSTATSTAPLTALGSSVQPTLTAPSTPLTFDASTFPTAITSLNPVGTKPTTNPTTAVSAGTIHPTVPSKELKNTNTMSTLDLLDDGEDVETLGSHELITAPLFTQDVLNTYTDDVKKMKDFPQYGCYGRLVETRSTDLASKPTDPRIFFNTNAPLSGVIVGVQGSGKSHSVSLILESMLIKDPRIGPLSSPLSAAVFHFGEPGGAAAPCEAAFIANCADKNVRPPPVVVYVSPASFNTMRDLYRSRVPTATVLPLYISERDLDARSMLSMLGVGTGEPPLYITVLLNILSSLGENFTYQAFLIRLDQRRGGFNPAQLAGLDLRLKLLESFLEERAEPRGSKCQEARRIARGRNKFTKGALTIIDLTDPFIEPSQACSLFQIILNLFVRYDTGGGGKLCLLDEAHKYLGDKGGGAKFTETLLSCVRQQRHFGLRVIISTQEPNVISPSLLALASFVILHRFSSAAWWSHLRQHCELNDEAFEKVVRLKTGTALVVSPGALGILASSRTGRPTDGSLFDLTAEPNESTRDMADLFGDGGSDPSRMRVRTLGRGYLIVKGRQRLTSDGGASILAVK